jgi:hypothetical protein
MYPFGRPEGSFLQEFAEAGTGLVVVVCSEVIVSRADVDELVSRIVEEEKELEVSEVLEPAVSDTEEEVVVSNVLELVVTASEEDVDDAVE